MAIIVGIGYLLVCLCSTRQDVYIEPPEHDFWSDLVRIKLPSMEFNRCTFISNTNSFYDRKAVVRRVLEGDAGKAIFPRSGIEMTRMKPTEEIHISLTASKSFALAVSIESLS